MFCILSYHFVHLYRSDLYQYFVSLLFSAVIAICLHAVAGSVSRLFCLLVTVYQINYDQTEYLPHCLPSAHAAATTCPCVQATAMFKNWLTARLAACALDVVYSGACKGNTSQNKLPLLYRRLTGIIKLFTRRVTTVNDRIICQCVCLFRD